jgi:hypothetical protein
MVARTSSHIKLVLATIKIGMLVSTPGVAVNLPPMKGGGELRSNVLYASYYSFNFLTHLTAYADARTKESNTYVGDPKAAAAIERRQKNAHIS